MPTKQVDLFSFQKKVTTPSKKKEKRVSTPSKKNVNTSEKKKESPKKKVSKKEIDDKYYNVRKSKVKNYGEDVAGAKRHHYVKGQKSKTLSLKEEHFPRPDIEEEIKKGKSNGHIWYHYNIWKHCPKKPKGKLEHNKENITKYKDKLSEIRFIIDNTKTLKSLRTHLSQASNGSSRWDYIFYETWVFTKLFMELITDIKFYGQSSAGKIRYKSARLEENKSYEELRDLFNPKKKEISFGDKLHEWREKQLANTKIITDIPKTNPTKLGLKYNFNAIQWGKSVSDKKRDIYLGLVDLSFQDLNKILNLSNKQLTLYGKLSIAIGARGSGNALATYNHGHKIINLTQSRGNGSLAHEIGHFFDFNLATAFGLTVGKSKALFGSWFKSSDYINRRNNWDISDELYVINKLLNKIAESMVNSSYYQYAKRMGGNYWTRRTELFARTFESYIAHKKGNAFLVLPTKGTGTYNKLYPQGEELIEISELFDKFFIALNPIFDVIFKKEKIHAK